MPCFQCTPKSFLPANVHIYQGLCIISIFYIAFFISKQNYVPTNDLVSSLKRLALGAEKLSSSSKNEIKSVETDNSPSGKNSMACQLPKLNPFDSSVLSFISKTPPANCEKKYPLIFTTDLKGNLIQREKPQKFNYTKCCYKSFNRSASSDRRVLFAKNCVPINNKTTPIPAPIEFIQVSCFQKTNSSKVKSVVVDMFGFVHKKEQVEKRLKKFKESIKSQKSDKPKKVNVVILGLDSVSHMNFQRKMPLTYGYITKNLSALGLWGYTKVGDNTFPNIVPVMAGMSVVELEKACWTKNATVFDNCPFIWKNYSTEGYVTSYGEDAVWMGIFNYLKKGFKNSPTDYHYNPLTNEQAKAIGHNKKINAKICYGPRLGFEVLLDYMKKLALVMDKKQDYFQFIWATSLFHDRMNDAELGDNMFLETLKWKKDGGYLDNTVLILMSDHGMRYGGIRSTLSGKLEERMPFLYFIFPKWFSQKYKSAVNNVLKNKNKLTSPFDLHETLKDLLYLDNITDKNIDIRQKSLTKKLNKTRGISLFLPIHDSRTCQSAQIPPHFCVCFSSSPVDLANNTLVEEAGRSVMHYINGMFIKFPRCKELTLNKILNAQVLLPGKALMKKAEVFNQVIKNAFDKRLDIQEMTFNLALSVKPSGATFEATTTRHTDGTWTISSQISRTNLYKGQSDCVSDYNLQKFCFCSK